MFLMDVTHSSRWYSSIVNRLLQPGSHRSQHGEEAAGNDNDRLSVANEQADDDIGSDGRIVCNAKT